MCSTGGGSDCSTTEASSPYTPRLWAKILPGVGAPERVPEGLSRAAAIEWAEWRLRTRWHGRAGWLQLSDDDAVFFHGLG